jgi:hypothetical protein
MTDWASTNRLTARVTLAEGLVIHGDVHLQPRVAWRDGPETPLELLNRDEAFFPLSLPNGDIVFVAKDQVAILFYAKPAAFDDPERNTAARTIPLEVMLVGGLECRGVALTELPPAKSRPLDFLNAAGRFFRLVTDEGTMCLNRRFVRAARPLS